MVEDFPEPVGRVASTTPLFRLTISPAAQVTGDLAKLGMLSGMSRITMAWLGYGRLQEQGSCDISYSIPGHCRFRVNIFV